MTSQPIEPEAQHVYGQMELPMMEMSEQQQRVFRYQQEFDYLTVGLREELEDRIADAQLPREVGMMHRQQLNEITLSFMHDKATTLIDILGSDFRPRQRTLYGKFIEANRRHFYETVVKNPTLEGMSVKQYPLLATRLQGAFPEVRMARRLFDQLYEPSPRPIEQQAQLKAVRDCLVIYGMTMRVRQPQPATITPSHSRPHIVP